MIIPFGFMKQASGEATNLVVNGTFDTDTDWTKGTGWSINTTTKVAEITTALGANSLLTQTGILTVGETYRISFEITTWVSGQLRVRCGYGTYGTYRAALGVYTEDLVCAGGGNFDVFAYTGFEGAVDNISIIQL